MIQDINPHKFDLTYGQPKAGMRLCPLYKEE